MFSRPSRLTTNRTLQSLREMDSEPQGMVKVLEPAPNFRLMSTKGEIELAKLFDGEDSGQGGKWVILFFYSGDFTSVCSTEVPEFSRKQSQFENLNAEVLGVSADSMDSHKVWISTMDQKIDYP